MTPVFVAGSHTDVGKTHVACALIRAARARGLSADAFKPVLSGFDPENPQLSDAGRLLKALGRPAERAALEAISPLRFSAPLAPPLAARREGVRLALHELVALTQEWLQRADSGVVLVEGAGGVMSPMAEDGTCLDLMAALRLPVLLVGGAYLGAISHTLSALEVVRARGLCVAALVVSECGEADAPDFQETVALTHAFAGGPVLAAPRADPRAWAHGVLRALWPQQV